MVVLVPPTGEWGGAGTGSPTGDPLTTVLPPPLLSTPPPAAPPQPRRNRRGAEGEAAAQAFRDRDFAVLYGYITDANNEGGHRLYLTWLLDEYVELYGEDILYWRKVVRDGGTLVWVDRTKRFRHGSRGRREKGYEIFLAGQLADQYLSGAPVGPAPWDPSNAGVPPNTAVCGYSTGCPSP